MHVNHLQRPVEHWGKITMGVEVFSINFLKEIAGAKPELDVVYRG